MDVDDIFTVAPVRAEVRARAAEAGWPDGLIDRVHALRWPAWRVELYLGFRGFPTVAMIEAEVADRERLTDGLHVREATWEDDERLTELFADAAERIGDWEVIVDRSPNPFAQQRVQENAHVKVVVDRGVAVASSAQAGRSSYVAGDKLSVGWIGGWRVRNGFRRLGYANMLMTTPGSAMSVFGMLSYWYVRTGNTGALGFIARSVEHAGTDGANDRPIGKLTATVHHLAANPAATGDARVDAVRPADVEACVQLINTTHDGLDLFRPYDAGFLSARLDDGTWGPKPPFFVPVYGWDDMVVLREAGEVVACAGLWDRGRNVRERWRHRATGEERLVEATCVLDLGFAPGRADAMASLLGHLLARTTELGRTAMIVALEHHPEVTEQLAWACPHPEERLLETMGFSDGVTRVDACITRPYTDLAYW
jgi:hypothetical protein